MERRNFLGLATLLGLAPILPRNIFTEEECISEITKVQLQDVTELEFGEPVDLSNTFQIEVLEPMTIIPKKRNYIDIIGKGFIDGKEVDWLIEIRNSSRITDHKLFINGKNDCIVEYIYQEQPEVIDYFTDDFHPRFTAIIKKEKEKTYINCKKI